MKYIKLGKTDLTVSRIILGCMGFGDPELGHHKWTVNQDTTDAIVKRALDLGINFFDTAMKYQSGTSEVYLGHALKASGYKRDDYVIATKITPYCEEVKDGSLTPEEYVEKCVDESLERLGVDVIDLYILHAWDTPMFEMMKALDKVVKEGKVKYLGLSNALAWQLAKCNEYARTNGLTEFVSFQGMYNLISREDEREMFPLCYDQNIAITPYSSMASGRLARRPEETAQTLRLEVDTAACKRYDLRLTAENDQQIIKRVEEVADRRGVSMAEIAISWDLYRADAAILGATKVSQIDNLAKAGDLELTKEEIAYLDELYLPHAVESNYKNGMKVFLDAEKKY